MAKAASSELPVGHPARPQLGRAVIASVLAAIVFSAFSWSSKELRAVYSQVPWQDDPYDAVVSFAIFFVPLLAGLCLLRVPLCRRYAPLPRRRALDLLRATQVLTAVVLATLLSDWVSVGLQAHRTSWTATTLAVISVLVLVTALTALAARRVQRARRALSGQQDVAYMPDWLADTIALGELVATRCGPLQDQMLRALRWLDRRATDPVRRHPLAVAALLSLLFGIAADVPKAVEEGYASNGLLLVFVVSTASMFAFLVIVGGYLRLVGHREWTRRRVIRAVSAACLSVPVVVAFRDSLWSLLGSGDHVGAARLWIMLLVVAVGVGCATFAADTLLEGRRHQLFRG